MTLCAAVLQVIQFEKVAIYSMASCVHDTQAYIPNPEYAFLQAVPESTTGIREMSVFTTYV